MSEMKMSNIDSWLAKNPEDHEARIVLSSNFLDEITDDERDELEGYLPVNTNKKLDPSDEGADMFCFILTNRVKVTDASQEPIYLKTEAVGNNWDNKFLGWMAKSQLYVEQDDATGEYFLINKGDSSDKFGDEGRWQIVRWTSHFDANAKMIEERMTWERQLSQQEQSDNSLDGVTTRKLFSAFRWEIYENTGE